MIMAVVDIVVMMTMMLMVALRLRLTLMLLILLPRLPPSLIPPPVGIFTAVDSHRHPIGGRAVGSFGLRDPGCQKSIYEFI